MTATTKNTGNISNTATKRIFVNSAFLYTKTFISVFVSILLSRFVLQGLGIEDYGIYNVVGGIIGLMGFVTATLSNSNTRFIANSLGKGDLGNSIVIFKTVKLITQKIVTYIAIALIVLGVIFVNFILKIPGERVFAANIVYACMVVNTVYSVLTAPYSGLLFAREKIFVISIIEIVDIFLKLGIAYLITQTQNIDTLILYAVLQMILSFLNRTALRTYTIRTDIIAKEALKKDINTDKTILKDILSFSVWNLLDSIGIITIRQGTVFLVNIFFGVAVNAAYGIAYVVNTQMMYFSNSLLNAIKPVVYKTYGKEDRSRQEFLTNALTRISIFLLSLVIVPLFVDIEYILDIWLTEVPEHTIEFIRLLLILTILRQLSHGLLVSFQAHGRIKEVQLSTFIIQVLNFPLSLILFVLKLPVSTIIIVSMALETVMFIVRLGYAKRILELNIYKYLIIAAIKPSFLFVFSMLTIYFIWNKLDNSFPRLIFITVCNTIIIATLTYFLLLSKHEKYLIKNSANRLKNKTNS